MDICSNLQTSNVDDVPNFAGEPGQKRRRKDPGYESGYGNMELNNNNNNNEMPQQNRTFLTLEKNPHVFIADNCKLPGEGSTLYQTLNETMMINMKKIDQITFNEGQFFLGEGEGYTGTVEGTLYRACQCSSETESGAKRGKSVNLWRYDKVKKEMFLSRSILITEQFTYTTLMQLLQCF